MPLKVVNPAGNMYPWVTHTHSHLAGECTHKCVYCYVDNPRFGRPARYTGPTRVQEEEFSIAYDEKTLTKNGGKYPATIFVEHMNDIGAPTVPDDAIHRIMAHCNTFPANTYVFQTKDPYNLLMADPDLPQNTIIGTTVETNRSTPTISEAPHPLIRLTTLTEYKDAFPNVPRFVTIEPVLAFDADILAQAIARVEPFFVNLGADSKNHNLDEPTVTQIMQLVDALHRRGIELREQHNLKRLKP